MKTINLTIKKSELNKLKVHTVVQLLLDWERDPNPTYFYVFDENGLHKYGSVVK